jgi:hypothetical protein
MAYPYTNLADIGDRLAINDELLDEPVLVVFDRIAQMALPFARDVKDPNLAEESRVLTFDVVDEGVFPFKLRDRETGSLWSLTGRALEGPLAGAQLEPIATYSAMWFAWGSFHKGSEIYTLSLSNVSNWSLVYYVYYGSDSSALSKCGKLVALASIGRTGAQCNPSHRHFEARFFRCAAVSPVARLKGE